MDTMTNAGPAQERARRLGRAGLLLTASKVWFMLSGFVLLKGLNHVHADFKENTGGWQVVTGLLTIVNTLINQGTIQAVARFTSLDPASAERVRNAAWRLQAILGGTLSLVLLAGADLIAKHIWDDPALATPLRYASV